MARIVLDEILDLIGSVSEGFPSYFWTKKIGFRQRYLHPAKVSFYIGKLNSRYIVALYLLSAKLI